MKERLRRLTSTPAVRWAMAIGAGLLLAIVGMGVGLRLAGPTEIDTELGRIAIDVTADAGGRVDAFVPIADWGIRANSFTAPFELELEVRSVDRPAALEAASGDRDAIAGIEASLEDAARDAVLRALIWGLAVTLLLAVALWLAARPRRASRRVPLAAFGFAVLGAVASVVVATSTFDSKTFASPSFYGRGQELAQLLDFFESQQGDERYRSTFEGALTNFSAYLSDAPRPGEGEERRLLLGSDLHNNGLVLPALARFAEDRPVLLAGDFGHEGNEAEARAIAPKIAALGDRVIAVSGNHDSAGMMQALVRDGVTVLTEDGRLEEDGSTSGEPVIEVDGLTMAGYSDPLEWEGPDPGDPDRIFSFSGMEDGDAQLDAAKAEFVEWFEALPSPPDVVLVHQASLARYLGAELRANGYSRPLMIASGHDHYQAIDRWGPISVVNAGTLGAGGFLRAGQESVGLGLLHLAGATPALQSVDLIQIEPLSGQAQADRVILDVECPPTEDLEAEVCQYEPG